MFYTVTHEDSANECSFYDSQRVQRKKQPLSFTETDMKGFMEKCTKHRIINTTGVKQKLHIYFMCLQKQMNA